MSTLIVKVNDKSGVAIVGAQLEGYVQCNTLGAVGGKTPITGSSDQNGQIQVDVGCLQGGGGQFTVSANGYLSSSEQSFNFGAFQNSVSATVALSQVVAPVGGTNCPPGFQYVNGRCVQNSSGNPLANIFSEISANWLIIIVFVAVIVFVALIFLNPSSIKLLTGAVAAQ